jgi:hypothetical protein
MKCNFYVVVLNIFWFRARFRKKCFFYQSKVIVQQIVVEAIIRSANLFQKKKKKQFCVSVDYQKFA